jgi:replicative DNA helicase
MASQITNEEIKKQLSISEVLRHYGGECTNKASGAWWCIAHETKGKSKTPSLVAKDERGTATCMSRGCFQADDIFGVIAKMENLDIRNNFSDIKKRACEIAGVSYDSNIPNDKENAPISLKKPKKEKKKHPTEEPSKKHLDYLKKIGVSEETARRFNLKARYDYILYPQFEKGRVEGYKGISITKDKATGKSKQFFEDYTVPLFHQTKIEEGKHLIFVEGEKDCLRLTEEILKTGLENNFIVLTITTGAKSIPNDILKRVGYFKPSDISIIYDNDKAGEEGSKKLAKALIEEFKEVNIHYFSNENKEGYDVTDFLNEGCTLDDILKLEKETFKKEKKTLQSSYPRYVINKEAIFDTLSPDKVLKTGYKDIDEQCPVILGENTIIVGRTGKGKTVLGVNFVNGILRNNKDSKVMVFSLELKKKAFLQRLLSAEYDVETWKIKKGFVDKNDTTFSTQKASYIDNATNYISAYQERLMIVDDIHSIDQIEKILENLRKELEFVPDYILIDYANILTLRNLVDVTKHVQISTWIKFLAKEKDIHVQAVCQANRQIKENDDEYARTENLADSDQYGRDAFIVYSIKTDKDSDTYSINPTKNRNGKPEEEINLKWNGKSGRIIAEEIGIGNEI